MEQILDLIEKSFKLKKYNVKITPAQIEKVETAIYNLHIPITENIEKITGLKRYRVLGCLNYLRKTNKIKRTLNKSGQMIYVFN